jgi:hypothetical protein
VRILVSLVIIAVLLVLDWLALHDIVRREPNLAAEYFTIVLSGLVYGGVAGYWVRRWRLRREAGETGKP